MWYFVELSGSTYNGKRWYTAVYSWGETCAKAIKNALEVVDKDVGGLTVETQPIPYGDFLTKALVIEVHKSAPKGR